MALVVPVRPYGCRRCPPAAFSCVPPSAPSPASPVLSRSALEEELQSAVDLGAAEQAPAVWYIALRAADRFLEMHGRVPGADDGTLEADAAEVHRLGGEMLAAAGLPEALRALFTSKHAQEM